jgi:hypothetical protein
MAVVVYGMPCSSKKMLIFWPFGVAAVRSSMDGDMVKPSAFWCVEDYSIEDILEVCQLSIEDAYIIMTSTLVDDMDLQYPLRRNQVVYALHHSSFRN